ncbi:hypothetical protein M3Y97_00137500 [Aphelenchoides bicaudatus]|nr:hypothetical protein M3Y97_00137500 [Aphelenchoides bicaudatus]
MPIHCICRSIEFHSNSQARMQQLRFYTDNVDGRCVL